MRRDDAIRTRQLVHQVRHTARRRWHDTARRLRTAGWRVGYRGHLGPPSAGVDDDIVADRVRSALGPLLKRRDLPHPHVMVSRGVALLHGDVATIDDALAVETAAAEVPGVRFVESRLHIGLLASDSRPSSGRSAHAPSPAMRRLVDAAMEAGCEDQEHATSAVRAVITALAGRLPRGERRHFFSHLPGDVRRLVGEPVRRPRGRPARTNGEFMITVAQADGILPGAMDAVVEAEFGVLRELVPEEAADVAAVLPDPLRELWRHAVPR